MADEAARPKVSTTSEERGVVLFLLEMNFKKPNKPHAAAAFSELTLNASDEHN